MRVKRQPSRVECLRVLGLGPGASAHQIKRAYRRLALRYHPDRHWSPAAGSDALLRCQTMFRQVTGAYAILESDLRREPASRRVRPCARCGDVEPVLAGLDDNSYCRTCLLRAEGKRSLPAPATVMVSCTMTLVGLLASAGLLTAWVATGWRPCWWLAVGIWAAAMSAMIAVCLAVGYAAPPLPRRIRPGGALRRWERRLAR